MSELLDVKKDFPVLVNNKDLVYLDTGATALKPQSVIDKINEYYTLYGVNVNRGVYTLSYQATLEYEQTRTLTAKFLNAKEKEIVFTKGASNGLNMVAFGFGMDYLGEGDEVITSELEHHSNVLPWMEVCKKKKANLKYIPLDSTGRITVEAFQKTLSSKTKVVALTYVSNVMGYVTPIEEITKIAHERGIIVVVDAAQAVPHMRIDVASLDCDFLAFSAHKMMGPTGFGILYGKYKYLKKMKPVEYGGDMIDIVEKYSNITKDAPFKFETGTPPVAEAIAFKEAIRYIEATVYNMTTETGIIAFNINKAHPHDAATIFDENHIALRAGHHCAQLTIKWLECVGTLRACIYIYNDYSDIDKFVEAVKEAAKYFEEW